MTKNQMLRSEASLVRYHTSGRFSSSKAPMLYRRINTDSFVILYGISGNVHIADSENNYILSPDNYLILAPNREYCGTEESPPGVSYYWAHFYINGSFKIEKDEFSRETLLFGDSFRIPLSDSLHKSENIDLLFRQLSDYSCSPHSIIRSMCGNILEMILAQFSCNYDRESKNDQTQSQEAVVANIVKWIRLNSSNIKKVGDIADHFGYSTEYLTTLVRKITSKSLIDHITEGRIETAKRLLCSDTEEISKIAHMCGFSDDKYFFRVFKKLCGVSPGTYRKTYFSIDNYDEHETT